MKQRVAVSALVLLFALAFSQAGSSPEATVRAFLAAFTMGDSAKAAACVEGAKVSDQVKAMMSQMGGRGMTAEVVSFSAEITGSTALAKVKTRLSSPKQASPHEETETVRLKKVGAIWLIVPPHSKDSAAQRSPINGMAAFLSVGLTQVFQDAKKAAQATASLSNVKQLSLATLMYASDWDDKLPRSVATWHKAIYPYCKNEAIFRAPGETAKGDSYALNPSVAGKMLAKLRFPAETVMVYQGKGGKLNFLHKGKAAVGFCDGHTKLVDAEAAKKLRWRP